MKQLESESRDAYWEATRVQLKAAQNRADIFTLVGLAAIGALLWVYRDPGDQVTAWTVSGIGVALVAICVPLWFVTRRKRRITATRGLICRHCGHVPHDTEVSEVVATRQCQHCDQSLA